MKKSQEKKILELLQKAGERGVHSFDLYQMYMPRFAVRINELRNKGYKIESKREGNGVVYILENNNERN